MTEAKRIAGNIIFLQPESLASKTMPFYYGVNTIGRRAENTIRIQQLSVSSNHAVLNVTSKSITIADTNSRNGVKINSDENKIVQNTEIAIDGGIIVYLGDVKCKFQRLDAHDSAEQTRPSRVDAKKSGKYEEFKNLLLLEDEEVDQDLQKNKKEGLEMKSRQEMSDSFSISEHFNEQEKKGGKANNKKDTKKNSKIIVEEKEEIKEEKKVEKPVQEKKKEGKKDSLERKNAKKNNESDVPAKITKPEEKQKEKQKEKEKPKGAKESKQVVFQQADKKSLEKEDVKSNISKEKPDKSDKSKAAKQKQKPKESKQPEKPKQRKTEKEQKKSKSLSKQAFKEPQREQVNKRDRKKSLHLAIQETRSEQQQISQKRASPSRSRRSGKQSEGEKTKRRTQSRKRLPSEVMPSDQHLPARRSLMNKRIMASGFILNLNKKYFCPVEAPEDGFDYLIMKEYKRTYKALFAISHGIPIIRYDWIRESQYFERTMKPENYYFKDLDAIYRAIEKVKDGQRIFRGLEFFLGSDEYHLKVEDIEMLIYSCGGEIYRKVGKLSPKEKESKSLVAIVRNKEAVSAKAYEEELKAMKKMGFEKTYTIELILDSCEKQAVDWANHEAKLR